MTAKKAAHELLTAVRDVLKDDEQITNWCESTYGQKHNVFCGVNNEDPPETSKYPLIALFYVSRKRSSNVSVVAYEIELATAVYDNDVVSEGNVFTYSGLLRVGEFRELVESAIEQAHLGKIDFNSDTWDEMLFPIFTSNTVFEFERPKNYRGPVR